jgi:mono/diheme cytochrome c family protein
MRCSILLQNTAAIAVLFCTWEASAQTSPTAPAARPVFLDQGWSEDDRTWFYTASQGSQMMPYGWFMALERPDSQAMFLDDGLARFGYLPPYRSKLLESRNPDGLPIGFARDDDEKRGAWIGMTCAACHTSRIEFRQKRLQIDGGPADADMFAFIQEVANALERTVGDDEKFRRFSARLQDLQPPVADEQGVRSYLRQLRRQIGSRLEARNLIEPTGTAPVDEDQLRRSLTEFTHRFRNFVDHSRTDVAWGPARLDAFGMIFNRATAADLNQPENNRAPNAPVSLPFLWDTSHHDVVQWNGSAPNVLAFERLARNVGEVLGVFGRMEIPAERPSVPPLYYESSVDRLNLMLIEQRLRKLTSPAWPRDLEPIDARKASAGKRHYDRHCVSCHTVAPRTGSDRFTKVVMTPVAEVGTDPLAATNARERRSKSGVLEGARMPALPPLAGDPLGPEPTSIDVVRNLVIGSILAPPDWIAPPQSLDEGNRGLVRGITAKRTLKADTLEDLSVAVENQINLLVRAKQLMDARKSGLKLAYKARPLNGIWATGPYLHNGSVPNLYQLLLPSDQRSTSFMVGSREFDPKHVGFRADVGSFRFDTSLPGNSNKGHEGGSYGTDRLTEEERWQLVEYLKTL